MDFLQTAMDMLSKKSSMDIMQLAVVLTTEFPQIGALQLSDTLMSAYTTQIKPEDLLKALHAAGFSAKESAPQVKRKFPDVTALDMGKMLVAEYNNPALSRTDTQDALMACGYAQTDVDSTLDQIFGSQSEYAASIQNNAFLAAPANGAYNFSTGDFTLESWVKPNGPGTIIARKGGPGGPGNGGFLLVLRRDSTFKLATDNGYGFYEIDSVATNVFDGKWHHIAGIRQNATLLLYLDGNPLNGSIRNNAQTPLNVNNGLRLLIGATDQYQEEFIHYSGLVDEVRVWNCARSQNDIKTCMSQKLSGSEAGLVGYWNFANQDGTDSSPIHNNMQPQGTITYVPQGPFTPQHEYTGIYTCAVKWGGTAGVWHNFSDFELTGDGTVKLGGTVIKNPLVTADKVSWSFEGNNNAASFTFKKGSSTTYFWPEGAQTKKLFEGWYQDPGSGPVDYRGIIKG